MKSDTSSGSHSSNPKIVYVASLANRVVDKVLFLTFLSMNRVTDERKRLKWFAEASVLCKRKQAPYGPSKTCPFVWRDMENKRLWTNQDIGPKTPTER